MYKVKKKFIAANGHSYEVGDLIQRHVYQKFSQRHKSRCVYTAEVKDESQEVKTTGTKRFAEVVHENKVEASEPKKQEEEFPARSEEHTEESDDDDNTENEIVAGAVGFGLGLLAGGNDDAPAAEAPEFGGFGGGDGGGGGAGDKW